MNIVYQRVFFSIFSLYMLLILRRWIGPWISFEMESGRWRWVPRLTDPLIRKMRQILPPMGPVDFGPISALVLVWFLRTITMRVLGGMSL